MGIRQVGVLHGLTKMVAADATGLSDGQLLRRFAATRDDGAFAALIQRHGPLVYSVCRNVLRHEHDAEDAFQATFLVLARRAGAIREGLALGGWLYRVAYRVSTKARLAADRRRRREAQVPRPEEDRPVGDLAWRELQGMLHEELNRLPEKYRAPFVLCVLSGKSKPEAAAELGWKEGTVSSRLAQAREKLRTRLFRRGVALSAILSGLAISENGAATAVPATLIETTRHTAMAFVLGRAVAGVPAALARVVLRGMSLARLRYLGLTVALVAVAGTVAVASHPWDAPGEAPPDATVAPSPTPAPDPRPAPAAPPPAKQMTFFGAVNDANGQPVPNARVIASVGVNRPTRDIANAAQFDMPVLGDGRADRAGSFELTVPRTDPAKNHRLTLLAKAPGFAFTTVEVGLNFKDQVRLRVPRPLVLIPGVPVKARLLDPNGQPARGVTVHLVGMRRSDQEAGILYYAPPVPLPDWPGPFVTDEEGLFTVPDVIPGTVLICQTRDRRYGPEWIKFQAKVAAPAGPPSIKLTPARFLTGRVVTDDTSEPLADTTIVVETPAAVRGSFAGYIEAKTGADGRYTIQPFPGPAMKVTAYPKAGTPYPVLAKDLAWPAGAGRHEADLAIPRGVLVRGTVEEAASGRRLAGAVVEYKWADRYREPADRSAGVVSVRSAVTGLDGTFAMAVPSGVGHVVVKAADPDYLHAEIPNALLRGYGKGGRPVFPDALATLRLAPHAAPQEVTLRLRRGVTVRGQVLGADGKPVWNATMYALHYRPKGMDSEAHGLPIVKGRFELPGCEPGVKVPVWVYDAKGGQGALAEIPADPLAEPVIVLKPTVSARARFVDQFGLPASKPSTILSVLMRAGAEENESTDTGAKSMVTVSANRVHATETESAPDDLGTVVFPGLIPGAAYTFVAHSSAGWSDRVTFTAPDTGTLDLGRISARAKPRAPFRVGQLYHYQPVASDPDGDPVTLSLVEGPPGMRMDPETSAVIWIPKPGQEGVHKVTIKASDPFGASSTQTYQLHVAPK